MEWLKSVTGKIVTALAVLAVVAGAISWWQMDPATRTELLSGAGRIGLWVGVVLLWPWASLPIIGRVARLESNLAGGVLVGAYTLAETALLAWLFHWHLPTVTAWTFVAFGALVAGVYNLLICDWIAEILE